MRLAAIATASACLVLGSCAMINFSADDPYQWLEEIEGERALAWVARENAQTLPRLEGDPRYGQLYADALAIANNRDRLPLGSVRDGYVYNFWQDETHVRGIWRRSPLAAYSNNIRAGKPCSMLIIWRGRKGPIGSIRALNASRVRRAAWSRCRMAARMRWFGASLTSRRGLGSAEGSRCRGRNQTFPGLTRTRCWSPRTGVPLA